MQTSKVLSELEEDLRKTEERKRELKISDRF